MAVFTSSLTVDAVVAVITLFLLIVLYFDSRYKYWMKRGIPYVKPTLFFGNFKDNVFGKASVPEVHTKIYQELKSRGERFGGFFEMHVPNLMILDTDLISRIFVKDFAHFQDRGLFALDLENDPLSNTVTNLTGQQWRNLRHKQTPAFSSGKLKGMFEQIHNCGDNLLKRLNEYAESGKDLEAKDVMGIFTTDVIASCAFGLQFEKDSPQAKTFKEMVQDAFPQSRFNVFIMVLSFLYRDFAKLFRLGSFPKKVTEYFLNLSQETVRHRKQNGIKRNDFLQLLLDIKEREENNIKVNHEEERAEEDNVEGNTELYNREVEEAKVMTDGCLAASTFLFLVAGSELSTTMSFLLYYLATYPGVQRRLQQEVDEVVARHGAFTYQAVKDMTYLDQCLQESLRLLPVAGFITRVCTAQYQIPGSDVVLDKGTRITIPLWAIHHDPQYHHDPEVFDPDRFVDNNYKPTPTYFPFGDGPRICIAMRFAILEVKICIARVMSRYTVRLSDKTQRPLQLKRDTIASQPVGGIWVHVDKRK